MNHDFIEWASRATVGEQIREARIALNMTQRELGDLAGCDNGYVSKIERGIVFPQGATLLRFARILEVPLVIGPKHRNIRPGQANTPRPVESWHKPTCRQIHKSHDHRAITRIHHVRPDDRPGWLKSTDAARRLGISRDRATVVLREAGVPRVRVRPPGPYWYRAEDVEAFRRERGAP